MNILIVNPNTSSKITERIQKEANQYITKDVSIKTVHVNQGKEAIETYMDEYLAVSQILKTIENESFDVLIIGCAGDPELHVLREYLDVPVLSLMETSMVMSSFYTDQFAVISTGNDEDHRVFRRLARCYGCENKLAKVIPLNCGVLGVDNLEDRVLDEINKLKKEYGVGAVIFGCAAFSGWGSIMSSKTGIEVMDGVSEAIRMAKVMFEGGQIKHGKRISQNT